jgi:hypothetical protein
MVQIMTPGEILTDRIRQALTHLSSVKEQRMIGGLAFMVNGKLCVGVYSSGEMMVRCDPQMTDELLTKKGVRRGEMRGKLMTKGWLLISPEGIAGENDFDYWIGVALDFNQKGRQRSGDPITDKTEVAAILQREGSRDKRL